MYKKIHGEVVKAMKEGNKLKKDVVKMLKSAIDTYVKDTPEVTEATDEVVLTVLAKEFKEMTKCLVDYKKHNKTDLIEQTECTLEVCEMFLPKKLSEEETIELIKEALSVCTEEDNKKRGFVMKYVKDSGKNVDMAVVNKNIGAFL